MNVEQNTNGLIEALVLYNPEEGINLPPIPKDEVISLQTAEDIGDETELVDTPTVH